MDERRANIDLAFRNGLIDYEVLPPADIWTGINSKLARKEKPVYLYRVAAFIAVLVSLSALAYYWSYRNPLSGDRNISVLGEESSAPSLTNHRSVSPAGRVNPAVPFKLQKEIVAQNIQSVRTMDNLNSSGPSRAALSISGTGIQPQVRRALLNISNHNAVRTDFTPPSHATLPATNVGKLYPDYLYSPVAEAATPKIKERWSISSLASPTYYGKITSGKDQFARQLTESEKSVVTYSGGLAVAYKLNRRLSIQSGLFYSSLGQEVVGISSYAGFRSYDRTKGDHNFELLTSNGKVTTSNSDVFLTADVNSARLITSISKDVFDPKKASLDYLNNTMRQSFSYLEMPVFLRYKVIDRSIDVNLIGGMSYNLLVNNSVYTVIGGSKYMIGTTEGLNMFAISSSVGMGMEYNFTGRLAFNLEPTFRYYINSFSNSSNSTFHPYSFGIFSGITYKF
jgi:hypothetical protein